MSGSRRPRSVRLLLATAGSFATATSSLRLVEALASLAWRDKPHRMLKQLELGQVAGADVAVAEATFAQAQATLSPLQKQLAVQRDLLTALIGRLPSQEPAERFELATLPSYRHPGPQACDRTDP